MLVWCPANNLHKWIVIPATCAQRTRAGIQNPGYGEADIQSMVIAGVTLAPRD